MCELIVVFRGCMRALTLSCPPLPRFSLTASPVDLRVNESRVILMVSGWQGGGKWHGLTPSNMYDNLRCAACFVVVCFDLILNDTLIVSYCALMVLCSRWMQMG